MSDKWKKPKRLFIEFYEVLSGLHFFHQDPGWDSKGQPKGQKAKRLTCRKTRASFYCILWNLIRTSLFPPGSRMGSQRTTKATKREMSGRQKNLNIVYWILRGPFKTSLFPTRIQDGIPRDGQKDEQKNVWQVEKPKRLFIEFYEVLSGLHFFHQDPGWDPKGQPKGQKAKRLTCRKTLASFYCILWNLIRTSLFPQGSRMGSQRATKATKREMSGRQKNLNPFYWILRGPFKTSLFPTRIQDGIPRDSQRDEKENVWQVKKTERLLIEFYEVLSGLHFFSTRIKDGIQRDNQRDKKQNVWHVEKP